MRLYVCLYTNIQFNRQGLQGPCSLEYGYFHSVLVHTLDVCGAFLSISGIVSISSLILFKELTNLFNSSNDSDSVGSIIIVPATGHDRVGA